MQVNCGCINVILHCWPPHCVTRLLIFSDDTGNYLNVLNHIEWVDVHQRLNSANIPLNFSIGQEIEKKMKRKSVYMKWIKTKNSQHFFKSISHHQIVSFSFISEVKMLVNFVIEVVHFLYYLCHTHTQKLKPIWLLCHSLQASHLHIKEFVKCWSKIRHLKTLSDASEPDVCKVSEHLLNTFIKS